MKKIIILLLAFIIAIVPSYGAEDFSKAKQIIGAETPCSQLADEQLEDIGEYYMEQMHPGEAHKLMHKMMGLEEGSKVEEQFHINMAKRSYCGENIGTFGGMMGRGMMGNYPAYYNYGYSSFWNGLWIIFLIGAITFVIWIIYKLTRKAKEPETPINILQRRYAKGEISKKQFEDMKNEIEEG